VYRIGSQIFALDEVNDSICVSWKVFNYISSIFVLYRIKQKNDGDNIRCYCHLIFKYSFYTLLPSKCHIIRRKESIILVIESVLLCSKTRRTENASKRKRKRKRSTRRRRRLFVLLRHLRVIFFSREGANCWCAFPIVYS